MSTKITLVRGDITRQDGIDAVVNAAHPSLEGGGGVDGAIHRAAGSLLLAECRKYPAVPADEVGAPTRHVLTRDPPWRPRAVRCEVGDAVVTEGFGVAKWVVHTVGPLYDAAQPENMAVLLSSAYVNSLATAKEAGAKTVAFPAISCGVFGYPLKEAAKIALLAAVEHGDDLDEVRFVLFDEAAFDAFSAAFTEALAAGVIRL